MAKQEKKDTQAQQDTQKLNESVDLHMAHLDRMLGEFDELHAKAVERVSVAITEAAKLATTSLQTAADLHSQWRKMAFDTARSVHGAISAS